MSNFSFFIGCDVSKSVIDIAYHDEEKAIYLGQFSNSEKGFITLFNLLKKRTAVAVANWILCFENTGIYSKPLLGWCIEKGIPCVEENALKISRSLGLKRGKDDKIDALDICQYTFEKRDSIKPSKLASPLIIKLKQLLARRDFLVKQRQSLKVSLKEKRGFIDDLILDELRPGNEMLLKAFNNEIKAIEVLISKLINSNPETKENHKLAQSIIGIGEITSAYMIAVTQNFTTFKNARKFACYCGVAPFPNRSGIKRGANRVSHIANKKLKSLFSNCIMSAIVHDPEIALYYKRKREEGKRSGIVLNAVKNKLIHRVFAVINRKSPYIKIMNYA